MTIPKITGHGIFAADIFPVLHVIVTGQFWRLIRRGVGGGWKD